MCKLWKKTYLCGCSSHLFRDRCTTALRSPSDTCDECSQEDEPRKSYFKCYDCLKLEVEQEKVDAVRLAAAVEEQKKKDTEKARQERIRREAEERAAREREEDARRERERRSEMERAKKDGGAWVEMGSQRRKGKKGFQPRGRITSLHAGGSEPNSPLTIKTNAPGMSGITGAFGALRSAPPTATTMTGLKENGASGVDPGGRAGRWGPSNKTDTPVRILKPDRTDWKKV
ncbi:hypothetical protein BU24DRAFT_71218 [Aaosphaeria arxii CBS 175.79]|uniref:Uncharacterized protein n=1 Tax=Aaosphaeria arxii CBS 175.79 TaxID=1450172 RepID=A0A6A5XB51_9PLEO|nr:uncharacterized protein BU24DRAFT_71218 [Aaosphaeria arxii CBS 175.79]KAF2010123.1 hypothetical protein BU24DRAFT_71218 [Aaosphaeria arxii CBS 175.79]